MLIQFIFVWVYLIQIYSIFDFTQFNIMYVYFNFISFRFISNIVFWYFRKIFSKILFIKTRKIILVIKAYRFAGLF